MRGILFLLAVGLIVGLALSTYLFDSVVSALGLALMAVIAVVGLVLVAASEPSEPSET
jgi:FtsH-binding integral membrane protein